MCVNFRPLEEKILVMAGINREWRDGFFPVILWDDGRLMGLMDFLKKDPSYKVKNVSVTEAEKIYKKVGIQFPSQVSWKLLNKRGDETSQYEMESSSPPLHQEDITSLEDGPSHSMPDELPADDNRGKRPSLEIEMPTSKIPRINFPSSFTSGFTSMSAPFGTPSTLGGCFSGSRNQDMSFEYTTIPSGNEEDRSTSEPVRWFVPSWSFDIEDDGKSAESVKDFLDHIVPPVRMAEA